MKKSKKLPFRCPAELLDEKQKKTGRKKKKTTKKNKNVSPPPPRPPRQINSSTFCGSVAPSPDQPGIQVQNPVDSTIQDKNFLKLCFIIEQNMVAQKSDFEIINILSEQGFMITIEELDNYVSIIRKNYAEARIKRAPVMDDLLLKDLYQLSKDCREQGKSTASIQAMKIYIESRRRICSENTNDYTQQPVDEEFSGWSEEELIKFISNTAETYTKN